MESRINTFCAR